MGYVFEMEEGLMMLLPGLVSGIPSGLFSIAAYILTALAIYRISVRRGLNNPWLAWIPVINWWLLGSLSDQYQYIVKGQNTSRRKWLLGLSILKNLLVTGIFIFAIVIVGSALNAGLHGGFGRWDPMDLIAPVLTTLSLALPFAALTIAFGVIRFIALYDVYRSLDPNNAVLYLVLSILFRPTEPFFLFFNREKDLGMPPRKAHADTPPEPIEVEYENL
jgi:hypothetical protein